MLKRIATYSLAGVLAVTVLLTVAGIVVKKQCKGRLAPGVTVCGLEVTGLTLSEAEKVIRGLTPDCTTELRCRFLPEMREEIEERVIRINAASGRMSVLKESGTGGWKSEESVRKEATGEPVLTILGNEIVFTTKQPLFRIDLEDTLQAVAEASGEVEVWEWLYGAMTSRPFRTRNVDAVVVWEEDCLADGMAMLRELTERDRKDAAVSFENGQVKVTESARGYRLETEEFWINVKNTVEATTKRLKEGPAEGLVLRFYVTGTALMPGMSTEQAAKCNTVLGEFSTAYTGAGQGRAQNIEAGARKLHGRVVLPGEVFSVAAALMPFTEENGYAAGGTYIAGQLSESIGGGVCQLSTTLYNALLQTKLEIVERYSHSMPVGYVPLGRDAAIAGDYKDLKFKNTTDAPVLLLCDATGTEVKVTVYGTEEAKRGKLNFESVIKEETEEKIQVEVYRTETGADGEERREKVSEDVYRKQKREP